MECKYREAVCELICHQHKKWFCHFYSECTRSQQDLTLTEANKHTCMHVDAVSSQSASLYLGHSKLIFSFWSSACILFFMIHFFMRTMQLFA